MTEVVEEAKAERGILVRTFGLQAQAAGDGRTINVRVVPFDEIADVADPPDFKPYREQFMPGVFSRNEPHAHRIRLRSDHDALDENGARKSGTAGIVGNGVSLTSTQGGYEGEFRFLDTPEAMTARELVLNGGYDGVSAEFKPIRSVRTGDGIVQRQVAHLDSVALATGPAYSKAEILALREEQIIDEALLPPAPNTEVLERCADLGIDLPEDMAILLSRAYTEAAWDGSASRWDTAEAYCAASAIDLNPAGKPKTKTACHLPFKEPGSGTINVNGVRAALARIGQGYPDDATQAQRDAAKSRLEKILNSFNSTTP
ncbi:MAG: HK97 family phage prohead protease [Leifsonia sp.]